MLKIKTFLINNGYTSVGITGGAGSGKSTLADILNFPTINIDEYFIGDSEYRKSLINRSKNTSEYIDSINQYNWWNWDTIERLVDYSIRGIVGNGKIIVEGALLGPPSILNRLDVILFVNTPAEIRFERLKERDGWKRTTEETMERFEITEFSENLYYSFMFDKYADKIYVINEDYEFSGMKG